MSESDKIIVTRWARKMEETLTEAFLYAIGEHVRNHAYFPLMGENILQLLLKEIASGTDLDCNCLRYTELEQSNEDLMWSEFSHKIRTELCHLSLSILRSLIRDALGKIEFPEDGVQERLKEKLPVLFADWDPLTTELK
jgi:hypothetical protein